MSMAVAIALVFIELFSRVFNDLTGKNISLANLNWLFTATIIGVLLITGLLAGSYPTWQANVVRSYISVSDSKLF